MLNSINSINGFLSAFTYYDLRIKDNFSLLAINNAIFGYNQGLDFKTNASFFLYMRQKSNFYT